MGNELTIISGPNGAGKTTFANKYLIAKHVKFLNADKIASTLSPNNFDKVRISAGKIFLKEAKNLVQKNSSFIIESTLSGKYLRSIIELARSKSFKIKIIFIFLENEQIAVKRIEERVVNGGHFIPKKDIIRRFNRSKENFWKIYKDLADSWYLFYNSEDTFEEVAFGREMDYVIVNDGFFKIFSGNI